MAEEIPIAEQYAAQLDTLEHYQPIWSGLKARRERSLVTTRYGETSGDPHLELSYQATNRHMDRLLEHFKELKDLMSGAVQLEPVPSYEQPTVEIPLAGYEARME